MRVKKSRIGGRVLSTVLLVAVAGCTSTAAEPSTRVNDSSTDVAFRACEEIACTGSIQGARYEIVMPKTWNGTLLLYNHGYRDAQPVPPSFDPVNTEPEPAPGWSDGGRQVGNELLAQGFALAGSSYRSNGWSVADAIEDTSRLYEFFRDNVAAPNRVYVWGDSLGGLIAAELAERSDWVSGAAPICGAVAGLRPNMDIALDVAYGIKTLVYPRMQLTGFTSYRKAIRAWTVAAKRTIAAAGDVTGGGTARILSIAAIADAPERTKRFDGSTPQSTVQGAVEGILTALGFATFGRYDVEQRVGGNPSTNVGTDYALRISERDRSRIDLVTPGATARNLKLLADGERVPADPAAREAATALGSPAGAIEVPVFAVHTVYDPLVLVQNQAFYARRVIAAGNQANLIQAYVASPTRFSEADGAPYGAGHCNFTAGTRVGAIKVLDDWVRGGSYPGTVSVTEAFGKESGLVSGFSPPDWPVGPDFPDAVP